MNSKLLTIAIPTYNGGTSLYDAVESCKNIDLPDAELEVLIVDNCSTDDSIDKLYQMYKHLGYLKIVKNEKNYGRIENWNKCLKISNGVFILFLFSNDLLATNNHLIDTLKMLKENRNCSIVNMPWIVSNFAMTNKSLSSQFFKRSPGNGFFNCQEHIKRTVESGRLPFVPLQSNLLRKSTIQKKGIVFDTDQPISADGIFLSELAIKTGVIGFYNKPSVIWRFDAPGRLHSQIKFNYHIKQVTQAFSKINLLSGYGINISKAIANYDALEYFIVSLLNVRSKIDIISSFQLLVNWYLSAKNYGSNMVHFVLTLFWRIIKLPLKANTLFFLIYNRVWKNNG